MMRRKVLRTFWLFVGKKYYATKHQTDGKEAIGLNRTMTFRVPSSGWTVLDEHRQAVLLGNDCPQRKK